MITISLCMIVRDEEAVLERCLEGISKAVDEIVIVDTGSKDRTKEIASRYTDKVFDFEWCDDFSAARNYAFSKASMQYQMWLDADDVVVPNEQDKLLELKKTLPCDVSIVTMKYHTHFDENDNPVLTSTRGRLFRRKDGHKWKDPIHEFVPLVGNIFHSEITIHHRKISSDVQSSRNIDIYRALEKKSAEFSPRQLYYFARELKDHGEYPKAIYYFRKFLDSKKGWVEDNIASCFNLSLCYRFLGDEKKVLPVLFESFNYDSPRAEICSEIGYYYKRLGNYRVALQWFLIAAKLICPDTIGFVLHDYWGYIPNLEACVCYYHLGDIENANLYNELASKFKPFSGAVTMNREFFAKQKQ